MTEQKPGRSKANIARDSTVQCHTNASMVTLIASTTSFDEYCFANQFEFSQF